VSQRTASVGEETTELVGDPVRVEAVVGVQRRRRTDRDVLVGDVATTHADEPALEERLGRGVPTVALRRGDTPAIEVQFSSLATGERTMLRGSKLGNGDSGGPHFLCAGAAETDVVVALTVTGDRWCRSTDKTYRLDTASARAFLGQFVTLP
jgi:hypothetical protein